ncbi:hypothetical protein RCO27_05890 [Sphingosinicella sp. LHD-64]|uniref:hypothetical protein n=1 Tax=Sphingosinicella sp. LHD-64 TaxID=3072139 RepID=UPI00280ECB66|nr:hypothetical protein [Sphingosinicella sp. LHD-64]MDQ8755754.1 hypothetical protein [Sphingosinicella sp. LHD-64]
MAYRDFAEPFVPALDIESRSGDENQAPFESSELQVIALAVIEAERRLLQPNRLGRFLARWFGFRVATPLANSRLEALRRFALLARQTGGRPPVAETERFLAAGFSTFQAVTLLRRALPLSAR